MARAWGKISGSKSKKKYYRENELPTFLTGSSMADPKGMSKAGIRRINVLNKLFMKNITDIMATGEVSEELLGQGIQVSKVKVAQDFKTVNVYWMATGTLNDVKIENLLKRAAGIIKHELSSLRVMGVVPYITFVKDKKAGLVTEVEELLKIADYPDDFTPSQISTRLKEDFELQTELPDHLVKKIQELEKKEIIEESEELLPEMRNDVFGLNQDGIMKKITVEKQKVKTAWEQYTTKTTRPLDGPNAEINVELERNEMKDRFEKYLRAKDFMLRPPRRSQLRYELPHEEYLDYGYDESDNFKDDDFIEEYDANHNNHDSVNGPSRQQ